MKIVQQANCPHCGHQFELPFKPVEQQILAAVHELCRHGGIATTQGIAVNISMSRSQTGRYLKKLEAQGAVRRVGERGGWHLPLAEDHIIQLPLSTDPNHKTVPISTDPNHKTSATQKAA